MNNVEFFTANFTNHNFKHVFLIITKKITSNLNPAKTLT